jgi:hypothetical protein
MRILMSLVLATSLCACLDGNSAPTGDGTGSDDVATGSDDDGISVGTNASTPQKVDLDDEPNTDPTCASHRRKGDGNCL